MTPDGRVIVVEMLITDHGPPSPAPLLDLDMRVMLTGERTAEEFAALFASTGLKLHSVTAHAVSFCGARGAMPVLAFSTEAHNT